MHAQVIYLWYGAWGNLNYNGTAAAPTTVKVLTDMAQSIGNKPWYNIATTYFSGSGHVKNKITYGGRVGIPAGNACYSVRCRRFPVCFYAWLAVPSCMHASEPGTCSPYRFSCQCVPGMRAQGAALSNNQIFGVVNCAITRKLVPYMTNAVYMVLGASNIQATSGARLYHS